CARLSEPQNLHRKRWTIEPFSVHRSCSHGPWHSRVPPAEQSQFPFPFPQSILFSQLASSTAPRWVRSRSRGSEWLSDIVRSNPSGAARIQEIYSSTSLTSSYPNLLDTRAFIYRSDFQFIQWYVGERVSYRDIAPAIWS